MNTENGVLQIQSNTLGNSWRLIIGLILSVGIISCTERPREKTLKTSSAPPKKTSATNTTIVRTKSASAQKSLSKTGQPVLPEKKTELPQTVVKQPALSPPVHASRPKRSLFQPRFVGSPTLKANPNPTVPLAAILEFTTAQPVIASLILDDGQTNKTLKPDSQAKTVHRITVLGFKPAKQYNVDLVLQDPKGNSKAVAKRFQHETGPLPADFPPLKTALSKPERMEPGVTLFNVYQWVENKANEGRGYLIAVDHSGDVVWYFRADHPISDVRQLPNGNLLYLRQHRIHPWTEIAEIDMLGNLVRGWFAGKKVSRRKKPAGLIRLDVDTVHHDVLQLSNGNFRAITTEVRRFTQFPTSETQPTSKRQSANVIGDVIVEYRPNGEIVNRWRLLSLLDPMRIGYGSLGRFWDTRTYKAYAKTGGTRDWSHANALFLDRKTGAMIVSVRHQDAVIKIDGKTNQLAWILANPSGWRGKWKKKLLKPIGKIQWPYHQHAPKITSNGTLLVYDNGNFRASPFQPKLPAGQNSSRVVEYAIDETAMTVKQIWEYQGDPAAPHYCPLFGDADLLTQTGNVLITDGGLVTDAANRRTDSVPGEIQRARIVEVSRKNGNEKVFELQIGTKQNGRFGWSVYRSERIADLYVRPRKSSQFIQ
jgi:arylsulfate sulfotransferase